MKIINFLAENSDVILALIGVLTAYDVGANIIPTEKNRTIIKFVKELFKTLKKFNRKAGGGNHE